MAKKQPPRYFYVLCRSSNLGGRSYYLRRSEHSLFGPYLVRTKTEAVRAAKAEFTTRFPDDVRLASQQTYVALTDEPPTDVAAAAMVANEQRAHATWESEPNAVITKQKAQICPKTGSVYFDEKSPSMRTRNEHRPRFGPGTALIETADLKKLFFQELREAIPENATPDFHLLNGHTITPLKRASK